MSFLIDNKEWVIGIFSSVAVWFGGLKLKKVFDSRDKIQANDEGFTILKNRIESLTEDYLTISQVTTDLQKSLYEKQSQILTLEHECAQIKKLISRSCINDCLKNV